MRPVCHLGYVVPNYDFAVRLFESVSIEAKLFLCCRLWPALLTSLFQDKTVYTRSIPWHMQRLYTNILCTQWLIYTNNKGHISHVVVLGQDTVVPPALAFAACFQIQH